MARPASLWHYVYILDIYEGIVDVACDVVGGLAIRVRLGCAAWAGRICEWKDAALGKQGVPVV